MRELWEMAIKDAFYRNVPLPLARQVLPLLPGRSPFVPAILESRTIFIHVPKVAGSSLQTRFYGRTVQGHRRIAEFYGYEFRRAEAFLKVAFVRNPWDRLLSAWSYLKQGTGTTGRDRRFAAAVLSGHPDFTEFVMALDDRRYRRLVLRYDHFRPQVDWICLPGRKGHAMDVLGRFERMAEDLAALDRRLGRTAEALPHVRPSTHRPYREAYTNRTREIAAEVYAADIALLGYGF